MKACWLPGHVYIWTDYLSINGPISMCVTLYDCNFGLKLGSAGETSVVKRFQNTSEYFEVFKIVVLWKHLVCV